MLAIAGGKGGCGKTTTAVGLATALARRGHEPLVVDGDSDMPDIHHRLELSREGGVDTLADGRPLTEAVTRPADQPRVAVLTGGRRDALTDALRRVSRWSGPVIVDCSAGTSPGALVGLRHADRAVLVTTDQPQCVQDTAITRTVAGRLSTALAGVVVRLTARTERQDSPAGSPTRRTELPPEWNVLARLPHVEEPLEDSRTRQVFRAVSTAVFPEPSRANGAYTNEDSVNAAGLSGGQNQKRYCRRNL